MKYKCPHCKEEVNESHMCKPTRAVHGEMVGTLTHYHANIGKVNKQTVFGVGYMKRFGSHAKRNKQMPSLPE